MENKGKKIATGLAILSVFAGGATIVNSFVTKTAKALLYRHHRDEDKPGMLENEYGAESIYIKNEQGIKLRGLFIKEEMANKTLVILHPFALEAKDMSLYVPFFKERIKDCNVLLIDASAHGQSDGYIRGLGIKDVKDLVLWNKYLIKNFGNDHKIIMYGKECGANTILNAAGKHVLKNVIAIISDGAYTSVYDILGYRLENDYKMPKFPTISLLKKKISREVKINIKEDTVSLVKHNDIPTLYFHSKEDDFVPLSHVYPLYNASRGSKVLFVVKEERYLNEIEESNEFKSTFVDFIEKYVK